MTNLSAVPMKCDHFSEREIEDETILLGRDGQGFHLLDDVGTFIWAAIDGKQTVGAILDRICEEYEVARETAEKDLRRFIDELIEKDIIEVREKVAP
jgi:hypothetical protein